jgi:hypothetical protein
MSGTIAVVANEAARYTAFSISLMNLKHPANTTLDWGVSTDFVLARNELVQNSLDRGSEWLLFLDDDHTFDEDLLLRLLLHEEPVVCSLYLGRQTPFRPIAFRGPNEEGMYESIPLTDIPGDQGLLPITAAGCAGMLIWSEVFRSIPKPWFEYGKVGSWAASEDIIFCEKARAAGFEIYLDPRAQLGHLASLGIAPAWIDEEWAVGFSVADSLRFYAPIEKAAEAEVAADAVRR